MFSKNSIMIRFIDVALTVLFGFVGISEIKLRTQLKLPNELNTSTPPQVQRETVSVRVVDGPQFLLLHHNQPFFLTDAIEIAEDSLVARYEHAMVQQYDFLVLIEPDPDSPIQLTVDLIDLCKKNGIPQNLNYLANAARP